MTDYDFIEIGTSNFDTLIENASDSTVGLSVEPLGRFFFPQLPTKPNVRTESCAISDRSGEMDMFFVEPRHIIKHQLPHWVIGCNSLGHPHPTVVQLLTDWNLPMDLIRTEKVPVRTYEQLMRAHDVRSVKYLKIDTEGHDVTVLRSMLQHCDVNPLALPEKIQFESNSLTATHETNAIVDELEKRGYHVISTQDQNTVLVRGKQ